ncbi:MAG: hypothetical protein AB7F20_01325 [Geoalkalibacter sp.]|jgi:predicted nucleic acid-binding protein|uniref:hypothetical protein n=1 Tax=Geoalkalibacter sp. TaxID=3041440 RepID=UPI002A97E457|nr:hypothetical protein [Thermodesulfobacteriota bacterium]
MKVVSNASPIIFLGKLGAVDLLWEAFSLVHIPPAVRRELGEMHIPDKIKITPVSLPGQHFVEGARGRLHSGELEAIVLSQEIDANLVLLDAFAKKHH